MGCGLWLVVDFLRSSLVFIDLCVTKVDIFLQFMENYGLEKIICVGYEVEWRDNNGRLCVKFSQKREKLHK